MNRFKVIATASLFVIVTFAFAIEANAQEKKLTKKDIPQAVISAFEKAYPNATVKGYSIEKENKKTTYEVESMQGKMTLDVSYLADGTAVEVEEGVAAKDLPGPVMDAVKAKFPDGKIVKAEKKTAAKVVTYEMRIKTGKTHAGIEVDPAGKIVTEPEAEEK